MLTDREPIETAVMPGMAPFVDVVFLLLVFLVCQDFHELEGKFSADLPKDIGVQSFASPPRLWVQVRCIERGKPMPRLGHTGYVLVGHLPSGSSAVA